MKIRFFTPLSLGVSAMLIATCGHAGAQTTPQNTQNPPPIQQTHQNSQMTNNETAMQNQNAVPPNTKLVSANAKLENGVNSKDATQGQMVKAKLTDSVKTANGMKLDDGTVLIGKVSQVQSNENGRSRISITFDQARLKDGRTIPVKATLLAAYPATTGMYYAQTGMSGALMGTQPKYIPSNQKIDQKPGTLGNVEMHSAVQSNTSGTFTSKDGNINLKNGTRLQVAIAPMSSASMG